MKFTDALDEYLEAKKIYYEAKESFKGYDFTYFHYYEDTRFTEAKNNLNNFFEQKELIDKE